MKARFFLYIAIFLFLGYCTNGQVVTSKIVKTIATSESIKLDSLSIIPKSFKLLNPNKQTIDSTNYTLNFSSSTLFLKQEILSRYDSVSVIYSTFPYDFSAAYYHKKLSRKKDSLNKFPVDYYHRPASQKADPFALNTFQKSGSISRGISAGNAQNLSVASDMNLQLSGMISPELRLTAAITDNNIPIQPEGNTQQLQDFDQVFIKLDHKNGSIIAGDFSMKKPNSYFLNYHKKSQGSLGEAHFQVGDHNKMRAYAGAAISRGNYNRFKFQGVEGNQGPYKLQGANFERYIVVLSGSEKVYMDGKLLVRGESNDYIINYNTAEIVFMPRIIVTKDKRFEVEFEYSQQYYSRALVAGGVEWEGKRIKIQSHFYSEGDMKNQPIDAPITDNEKMILGKIGDSLNQAIIPAIDSTNFNPNRVMYKMIDSLGYDSVFVYSTHSDSAFYQLSFSFVGAGNGNYIQKNTSANGRVFQWVAPISNQAQGSYAPVKLLVTPKKQQMLTTAMEYNFGETTKLTAELALSVHDLNTFSSLDANNNTGFATKINLSDKRKLGKKKNHWILSSGASYEYVQKNFNPIERFRSVEFDRDWNNLGRGVINNEQLMTFGVGIQKNKLGGIRYKFKNYNKGSNYKGLRHITIINWQRKGFVISGNINSTSTENTYNTTNFLRHHLEISQSIKGIKIGLKENAENNLFHNKGNGLLLPASYSFNEFGAFINSSDTSKIGFRMEYQHRKDSHSDSVNLSPTSSSNEIIAEMSLLKNPKHRFKIVGSYRSLIINDPLSQIKPDESARGRAEYRSRMAKGALVFSAFYETNSGLEVKKEYSYIEVAPGQGVYSWIDYNNNGIKELDEFQPAAFQDQANFIRIFIPTSEYVKTYGSRFNTTLIIRPANLWRKSEHRALQNISRFSDNLTYRSQIKTQTNDLLKAFNPFNINIVDPKMVYLNSFFKNTLYYHRNNPVFGMDWTFKYNKNKMLMINGYEGRASQEHQLRMRWNIGRKYLIELAGNQGNKVAFSEFFDNRDFNINFQKATTKVTFQPNRVFRLSLAYQYTDKINNPLSISTQQAINNSLTLSGKLNTVQKGNLSGAVSYIDWKYSGADGDQLAFEMLEGFRKGVNVRWNLAYNRTLMQNLQLTLIYNGRKPAGVTIIHTGMVQIRAYF